MHCIHTFSSSNSVTCHIVKCTMSFPTFSLVLARCTCLVICSPGLSIPQMDSSYLVQLPSHVQHSSPRVSFHFYLLSPCFTLSPSPLPYLDRSLPHPSSSRVFTWSNPYLYLPHLECLPGIILTTTCFTCHLYLQSLKSVYLVKSPSLPVILPVVLYLESFYSSDLIPVPAFPTQQLPFLHSSLSIFVPFTGIT